MSKEYEILVEVDMNDGDYCTSVNSFNFDNMPLLEKIVQIVKNKYPHGRHNWECGEIGDPYDTYSGLLTEYEIDFFSGLMPYCEYGFHTIEKIEVYEKPQRIKVM